MVGRAGHRGRVPVAVFNLGVVLAQVGGFMRRDDGLHLVFHGLRIHALVHASAEETARGTVGDFLPVERASPVASSLYAQELQRRAAIRGFVPGHAAAALEGGLCAGARRVRAQRAAAAAAPEARDGTRLKRELTRFSSGRHIKRRIKHALTSHFSEKQALTVRRVSGFISGPLRENLCMPF